MADFSIGQVISKLKFRYYIIKMIYNIMELKILNSVICVLRIKGLHLGTR